MLSCGQCINVLIDLLAPIQFDSRFWYKHVEGRIQEVLNYFVM